MTEATAPAPAPAPGNAPGNAPDAAFGAARDPGPGAAPEAGPDARSDAGCRPPRPPRRATARFMLGHPARWVALGFGSGLAPWAPGTVGTLWAWLVFLVLDPWLGDGAWGLVLLGGFGVGWWACTRCAQHLGISDPGAIVWDEVLAFWLVLWLLMPAGFLAQLVAFGLFRWLDAAKPGPVGWADRRFKLRPGTAIGWREGFGILFDDLLAAGLTLLLLALGQRLWALT